jgi:3-dehydroquinate synthase class II
MLRVTSQELEEALRKALGSFALDRVELNEGFDHDGEAAVFVTAFLRPHAPPMPGEISGSANVAVSQALRNAGDERLSYLYIRRPDDERPAEEEAAASSQ